MDYNPKDLWDLDIPSTAKYELFLKGTVLKAEVIYENGDHLTLDGVDSINTALRNIYDKEGKVLKDLIIDGRLSFSSSKIWDNYEVTDGKYFNKLVVEKKKRTPKEKPKDPPKEPPKELPKESPKETPKEPPVNNEEEDTKKGGKIKKLFVRGTSALLIIALLAGFGWGYVSLLNYLREKNKKTNDDDVNDDVYEVTINDDGNEYTYNLTDEEIMEAAYADEYDYTELGSSITSESMDKQLKTIDKYTNFGENQEFSFEELVVSDDYDAVKAVSDMGKDVANGSCTKEEFMDAVVNYVFQDGYYINSRFIEQYNNLHPYSQYIIIRMSQGVLRFCPNYSNGPYDRESLVDLYDTYGSDLTIILNGSKVK